MMPWGHNRGYPLRLQGSLALAAVLLAIVATSMADKRSVDGTPIPTGKLIPPTAAKGAIFQELDPGLRSKGNDEPFPSGPTGANLRVNRVRVLTTKEAH